MQTDTDYYDGRWNKVSNVRLFFTELNIAFLPKDLINNCREELIEYTKHNESGIKNYFSTYGTSLETTHNIGKATGPEPTIQISLSPCRGTPTTPG